MALSGDIKQAFLQVRIRAQDRDSLRFHWFKDMESQTVEVLRFTRALFGLVQSPFLLNGTLQCLLGRLRETYPTEVDEIEKSLYVDDIVTGGETTEAVNDLKTATIKIFEHGSFTLHKWHSNKPELEGGSKPEDTRQSYAKEQLGVKLGEKAFGTPLEQD